MNAGVNNCHKLISFLFPRLLTPMFATWSSYEGYLEGMSTSKGTLTDEPLYKAGAYLEGMRTSKGTSTDEPLYKGGGYLEGLCVQVRAHRPTSPCTRLVHT